LNGEKKANINSKKHREEERQLIIEDRRTAFQRETLLSLQEELFKLTDIILQAYQENNEMGWYEKLHIQQDTFQKFTHISGEMAKLRARVFDKQLILLVHNYGKESFNVLFAKTKESNDTASSKSSKLYAEANGRIGELLKEVY
jgi:hypothetical protein